MGLLTALAVGLGAAGAMSGAKEAKKSRQSQEAAMARQDTLAREMGRLNMTKESTGADIVLGTDFTKGGARNGSTSRQTVGNASMVQPTRVISSANSPLQIMLNSLTGGNKTQAKHRAPDSIKRMLAVA